MFWGIIAQRANLVHDVVGVLCALGTLRNGAALLDALRSGAACQFFRLRARSFIATVLRPKCFLGALRNGAARECIAARPFPHPCKMSRRSLYKTSTKTSPHGCGRRRMRAAPETSRITPGGRASLTYRWGACSHSDPLATSGAGPCLLCRVCSAV